MHAIFAYIDLSNSATFLRCDRKHYMSFVGNADSETVNSF